MRVAVVYHKWVSDGGLEGYLLGLVGALADLGGHEVTVVTASADWAARSAVEGRASVKVLPGGRVRSGRDLLRFDEAAAEATAGGAFDVVLGFGRTTRQDIHRAGGGCHRVYSRMLPARRRWGAKDRAELELEERLYTGGGTRLFVVNSHMVAGELEREYGIDREKIEVVYTAVDTGRYAPAQAGARQARPSGGRLVFLYAAREHRRKGLGVLLEAFGGIDAELRVAGPVPPRALRTKAGAADIVFLGEPESMVEAYRGADFFVHPTRYDACANTVLQSMACGLPGIISSRDGASQFVDDGVTGIRLDEPEDAGALRAALGRACALGPEARLAMGRAARERVLPLTWEAHVARWAGLITRLGGRQGGS